MGCNYILQIRGEGPVTGSDTPLCRDQMLCLRENPILYSMFIWCQTSSFPQERIAGPQRNPDISIFLIADLWCARRPAMFHSSLWGSFVPGQSWTEAVWWPRLQWSSSSLLWGLQESWGDCCVAKKLDYSATGTWESGAVYQTCLCSVKWMEDEIWEVTNLQKFTCSLDKEQWHSDGLCPNIIDLSWFSTRCQPQEETALSRSSFSQLLRSQKSWCTVSMGVGGFRLVLSIFLLGKIQMAPFVSSLTCLLQWDYCCAWR